MESVAVPPAGFGSHSASFSILFAPQALLGLLCFGVRFFSCRLRCFYFVVSPCCCFVLRIVLLLRIRLGFFQKYLAMASERKRKLSLFDVVDDGNATTRTKTNGFPALNPYTNKPYSTRYHEILERRRELPVWQQKQEFLDTLAKNQTMILVGETGSGKTTQVRPQHTFPTFA